MLPSMPFVCGCLTIDFAEAKVVVADTFPAILKKFKDADISAEQKGALWAPIITKIDAAMEVCALAVSFLIWVCSGTQHRANRASQCAEGRETLVGFGVLCCVL